MNTKNIFFMLLLTSGPVLLGVRTGHTAETYRTREAAAKDPRMATETWQHYLNFSLPTAVITALAVQIFFPQVYAAIANTLFGEERTESSGRRTLPTQHLIIHVEGATPAAAPAATTRTVSTPAAATRDRSASL